MRVLVTGGCGYVGAVLVPNLLEAGHYVRVLDTQWFDCNLHEHPSLEILRGDIRERQHWCDDMQAVIHLAAIANDPCGELDARLTWDVNVLGTLWLAEEAKRAGVKHFIYASSASIYGVKDGVPVTEEASLEPVSDYNRTKMIAERVLLSFSDFALTIIRPATLCGMSPRMRLDTSVNMLTMQALQEGRIQMHCGEHGEALMRPHTHVRDIVSLYTRLLEERISGTYNAGFENMSMLMLAKRIHAQIPCSIEVTRVKDKRSYAVDSARVREFFTPIYTVDDAIAEIATAYREGFRRSPESVNLEWMRSQGLLQQFTQCGN